MHNKIQSVQCFVVMSAKRVAVFQARLKLVREEARAQLSNKENEGLTCHWSNCLHDWQML